VNNHPFVDGNKRTGFLAAQIFLKKSGLVFTASEEDAYNFVINIASSKILFEEIVGWLKNHTTQR
jgi:death on curing protein